MCTWYFVFMSFEPVSNLDLSWRPSTRLFEKLTKKLSIIKVWANYFISQWYVNISIVFNLCTHILVKIIQVKILIECMTYYYMVGLPIEIHRHLIYTILNGEYIYGDKTLNMSSIVSWLIKQREIHSSSRAIYFIWLGT
jgi:hypothetical protein